MVDVVVVVDVVDSRCRIGEMAARIMTKLGTVAFQVGASFSSESYIVAKCPGTTPEFLHLCPG